ncbi:MAG: type II 3-dehydroquinate dehydratase [Halanaerobiaceae bacterium]
MIAVVHGPNLNLLGSREPDVYGVKTLPEINELIEEKVDELGLEVSILQSNHEGEIIDFLHEGINEFTGIIINAGAFTHYSIALHDALRALRIPVVEVHLSNIYQREEFRHHSVIAPVAVGQISGLGYRGYLFALEALKDIINGET